MIMGPFPHVYFENHDSIPWSWTCYKLLFQLHLLLLRLWKFGFISSSAFRVADVSTPIVRLDLWRATCQTEQELRKQLARSQVFWEHWARCSDLPQRPRQLGSTAGNLGNHGCFKINMVQWMGWFEMVSSFFDHPIDVGLLELIQALRTGKTTRMLAPSHHSISFIRVTSEASNWAVFDGWFAGQPVSEAQNEWNWFTWEDLWEGKVEAGGDLVWWPKLRVESGIHELQSVFMVGVMSCSLIRSFYRVIPSLWQQTCTERP